MTDYIKINPKEWLQKLHIEDIELEHPGDGEVEPVYISTLLKLYGRFIIDHAIETCNSHSDSEIDKDGSRVNLYDQFGL